MVSEEFFPERGYFEPFTTGEDDDWVVDLFGRMESDVAAQRQSPSLLRAIEMADRLAGQVPMLVALIRRYRREAMNLRSAIDAELKEPGRGNLDYALDFADSPEYGRH